MRETIETTYADLRPDDLVIDKTGKAWPIAELESANNGVWFWLCDPISKVKQHLMNKAWAEKVTVSRIPKQADEAAKLEADFPKSSAQPEATGTPKNETTSTETLEDGSTSRTMTSNGGDVTMAEAVANVEAIGGTVEAEVTAEEVDAANASTEEKPNQLPPFESMTILEMRSHLYLLHGVYAHDMKSRDETIAMHTRATAEHAAGRLQTPAHIPHTHDGEALK